jgi:hypothetical protein
MAKNENRRIRPAMLQSNEDAFAALQDITGYNPPNSTYVLSAVTAAHTELVNAQTAEVQAAAAADKARDIAAAKEWEFHNLMLRVKDQVIAQFGDDSPEVQALGLKRKSEYKSPKRSEKSKE